MVDKNAALLRELEQEEGGPVEVVGVCSTQGTLNLVSELHAPLITGRYTLMLGDCLDRLKELGDGSVDSVVVDPPYGLGEVRDLGALLTAWMRGETGTEHMSRGFMGKDWDVVPAPVYWKEIYRVLKPGGHLLAFAGTRTQDLMGISIRLAGFEYRNEIQWIYASGFPKSLNVAKALDRMAGAERATVGEYETHDIRNGNGRAYGSGMYAGEKTGVIRIPITEPATEEARTWSGWGSDLKPAHEPILMFRKPLSERNIAANVLRWGTGAINVEGCRVGTQEHLKRPQGKDIKGGKWSGDGGRSNLITGSDAGRFPPNLVFSHSMWCAETCSDDCPVAELDRQSGVGMSKAGMRGLQNSGQHGGLAGNSPRSNQNTNTLRGHEDAGGASRFFPVFRYEAKPSQAERNAACGDMPARTKVFNGKTADSSAEMKDVEERFTTEASNFHVSVKPVELMRWLVRLVTPPDGLVLDAWLGSGTTGAAAMHEGFRFVGVEREPEYMEIARRRVAWAWQKNRRDAA